MSDALTVGGLVHTFDGRRALDECSFTVPAGSVTALVGRNGAGKTTLLRAAAGLLTPDRGRVTVFGAPPGAASLPRIGYVGQQAPLYRTLTVAQTLRLGARLNPRWDTPYAQRLADAAQLPPAAKVGTLAPGQRMRLALVLALGKRPGLLLLDEPLAHLDPVARTEAAGALMAEVAEHGTTVVLSSHVVADIEGVCDRVVVLAEGRVLLAAEVDDALAGHYVAVGGPGDLAPLDGAEIVETRPDGGGFTALVRIAEPVPAGRLSWHRPTLEEMLLGYLRGVSAR
ncbi:ABC transporter ATP-binding protein [Actinoplanes sp. NPDC049548]|uniref:ABC transporter ATP-binding protein n=1 Tax=Actinoplanes sp. NPDC049548 TaxID=3155152 RepID=UPI003422009A